MFRLIHRTAFVNYPVTEIVVLVRGNGHLVEGANKEKYVLVQDTGPSLLTSFCSYQDLGNAVYRI